LAEVRRLHAVAEARRPGTGLAHAEQRLEERRLPGAVRPHEGDVLAALEREADAAKQHPVADSDLELARLGDCAAAPGRLQELEAEAARAARQELELALGAGAIALQARDLRQLRLRLLRLRLLVPEPLHEAPQARDVLLVAVDRLASV